MNLQTLQQSIQKKQIKGVDISTLDIDGFDFSGCEIENVIFANDNQTNRIIRNVNFKDTILKCVSFDGAIIENVNFDQSKKTSHESLKQVSFLNCEVNDCRFRNANLAWCDFRYSKISNVTFEGCNISYGDFYRTFFLGVGIFRNALIKNCSLYYTYFDEGASIKKENIEDGKLLQQSKSNYRKFLVDWKIYGTGIRKNNQKNGKSDWSPEESLKSRYAAAEDIYKNLNGLWMSKGFLSDANWAYVQGKKMERNRLLSEIRYGKYSLKNKASKFFSILFNFLLDILFGYGESIRKMILTYIFVIIFFAYFFYASTDVPISSYLEAIGISFKNMVAMSPKQVNNISPFLDFLNVLQTTIGILLTGIFGFILGNKIRNQ